MALNGNEKAVNTNAPHISFRPDEPPLKLIKKLTRKKEAESYQLCLVEGWKCFEEANQFTKAKAVILREGEQVPTSFKEGRCPIYHFSEKNFQDICNTQSPEGILGIFPRPTLGDQYPEAKSGELHLILYEWRDPSNLGAVIRSARGLGASSVSLCGSGPDFFSSKVIRTSMGSVFHTNLNLVSVATPLPPKEQLFLADAKGENIEKLRINPDLPVFLLIGSESHGWPTEFEKSGQSFSFPLENQLESLSAPIAASLSLYAFKNKLSFKA